MNFKDVIIEQLPKMGYVELVRIRESIDSIIESKPIVYMNEFQLNKELIDGIISDVCRAFDININQIKSRRRFRAVIFPRYVSYFILKEVTDLTLESIGDIFGGYHHSSVIHGLSVFKNDYATNSTFKKQVDPLLSKYQIKFYM